MKFATALSFLIATGSMVSALPSDQNEVALQDKVKEIANSGKTQGASHDGEKNSKCIPPLLCCGTLTTPLDPLLDPILLSLGIDAAKIVGSIGLLCHPDDGECKKPQCCSEINLLGGTLALGCEDAE